MDYYFVSKDQFEEWIRAGELLEWALVYGEYKGIPKSQAGLLTVPAHCHRALSTTHPETIQQAACEARWGSVGQTRALQGPVSFYLQDRHRASDLGHLNTNDPGLSIVSV